MTQRRILLTGASGFVGHHLASLLLSKGHQVFGLDRGPEPPMAAGVEPLFADLMDPASMKDLPQVWDAVVHLAGASIPSLFSSSAPVISNLQITLNLMDHLREARVLLVSSCHVYGASEQPRKESDQVAPQGRYGLSKHLVEQVASHYLGRLDVRVARPFNHLGVGLRPELMIPSLLRRLSDLDRLDLSPVRMMGWNSVRDFIDVRDVASAYEAILDLDTPSHRTFNVCTGVGQTIESVVKIVLSHLGLERPVEFQGNPNSSDDVPTLVGDPSLLRQATGWRHQHSLSDSLRTMLQALQP